MRYVVVKFAEPVGDLADAPAGNADAALLDVEQRAHAVHFRLNDPAGIVLLEARAFLFGQIVPVAEEHRPDFGRQGFVRVRGSPMVFSQGRDVGLLAFSSPDRDADPERGACRLEFGQRLQQDLLAAHGGISSPLKLRVGGRVTAEARAGGAGNARRTPAGVAGRKALPCRPKLPRRVRYRPLADALAVACPGRSGSFRLCRVRLRCSSRMTRSVAMLAAGDGFFDKSLPRAIQLPPQLAYPAAADAEYSCDFTGAVPLGHRAADTAVPLGQRLLPHRKIDPSMHLLRDW